jgi:tetratricopeptide (TPR) repeat protein
MLCFGIVALFQIHTGRYYMVSEKENELSDLIKKFEQAPESRAFAPLADAYRKRGEIDSAISICEKGLENYPNYASARVILGKCFYDKGATERARSEFHQVLDIDSENMVALKYMGDISLAEDKQSEAAEYFRRLLEIDFTNEEVSVILDKIESGLKTKGMDLSDEESVRNVQRPEELTTVTLAGIYAAQGYYKKALKIYEKVLEDDPENEEAARMMEKIKNIISSSEEQRKGTFGEDVMTISLDEVSDDIGDSTSGRGGKRVEGGTDGEDFVKLEDEKEELGEGGQKLEETVSEGEVSDAVKEIEEEDRKEEDDEEGKGEVGEGEDKRDMDNFKTWVEKLRDKSKSDD